MNLQSLNSKKTAFVLGEYRLYQNERKSLSGLMTTSLRMFYKQVIFNEISQIFLVMYINIQPLCMQYGRTGIHNRK